MIEAQNKKLNEIDIDAILLGMFKDELNAVVKELDELLNGTVSDAINKKHFTGKAKESLVLTLNDKFNSSRAIIVGLGEKKDANIDSIRRAAGFSTKIAREMNMKSVATRMCCLDVDGASSDEKIFAVAEGTMLSQYQFNAYKSDKSEIKKIDRCVILCGGDNVNEILTKAKKICAGTILARELVNKPSNVVNSLYLEKVAVNMAKDHDTINTTVFGKEKLKQLGMNLILGVNQGSGNEPKLLIVDHTPKGMEGEEPICLVGKGVTFDSGGLSLKPPKFQEEMKMDMGGAAVVLATMKTVAELGLPVRIIGVTPCVENMTGASAQRPGDIVEGYNKKTVEILNTDAEGRLILADALAYTCKELKPKAIIDLATLTGAAIVCLGYWAAPMVGTGEDIKNRLRESSKKTNEKVWELPLWQIHKDQMKSENADLRNIGKSPGYQAGTITAGAFLSEFVTIENWVHLDIAGTAWGMEETDYVPSRATGYGVRLLTNFLENYK